MAFELLYFEPYKVLIKRQFLKKIKKVIGALLIFKPAFFFQRSREIFILLLYTNEINKTMPVTNEKFTVIL